MTTAANLVEIDLGDFNHTARRLYSAVVLV